MPRFLLDEQISPAIARGLRRQSAARTVLALAEWEDGRFLGASDELILSAAAAQKLILVTYDRRTIPPLLKNWAEAGRSHGGVVFGDEKTVPASDIGGLMRALLQLAQASARWDWTSRVCFLRR
jgi:hypothetical protein